MRGGQKPDAFPAKIAGRVRSRSGHADPVRVSLRALSMNCLRLSAFFALSLPPFASAAEPLYANDFQSAEVGKTPKDFLVISGAFTVQQDGANKVLELPGEPLDTFGALFGPTEKDGLSVSARFFGTKTGRKFPAFGLSVNGAGGWRLQVSAAKKALEIFKGDDSRISVPFEWTSGAWTSLRIQVRKTPAGSWVVEGKAWLSANAEPQKPSIALEEKDAPSAGRPGIWGSPFSGTPIRFDDLLIVPAS